MKIRIFSILYFFNSFFCFGQTSLKQLALEKGQFVVGFKHYVAFDSTRTYKRASDWNNKDIPRPIPVSIWYPAVKNLKKPLIVLDYMEILKEEEEWEHLPNEQILKWFNYSNTPQNREHLKEKTTAFPNPEPVAGKFPIIVYAPSYQASSIENFALCELLVSHGFIIISSPSRGTESRLLEGGTAKDLETQARDIEFLMREISKFKNGDQTKLATMGFSFGGLSNVLTQMRNGSIKAIVSLDGSIKYQYATLQKSPFAKIEKVNVPFIHMAQKDIPKSVLVEDKLDSTLNTTFEFFDNLINSRAYSLKFNNLTHSHFSALGVFFQERDKRQDKSDREIQESYKWLSEYTLNFLNAFLKNDKNALAFLERQPHENGLRVGLVTKKSELPKEKEFSFEDFNVLAANLSYKNLDSIWNFVHQKNPSFTLEQGKLNNLGLQLLFNPKTSEQGLNVLIFATKIYPESANLFDSLAEAFLFVGNKNLAIKNFKKSLTLDAQNQNAVSRLKELK